MRAIALLGAITLISSAVFAAPSPKITLLESAKTFFSRKLTDAEVTLFTKAESGEESSTWNDDPEQNDPTNAANWPESRVVHAACLEWLCKNREAASLVSNHGIELLGVRIDGNVDLEDAAITFPFDVINCAFNGDIYLRFARIPYFRVKNCRVRRIDGNRLHVDNDIFLESIFGGPVVLANATIGGDLGCDSAHLVGVETVGTEHFALNADGARIDGRVFLRKASVKGEVRFLGATIGRSLECDGAQLSNSGGETLDADAAEIKGRVLLRAGFRSEGTVDLLDAKIGGSLECVGAQFSNPKGDALLADRSQISGNVLFSNGFTAHGEVRLLSARIAGKLDCTGGAHFNNSNGTSFNANEAHISGDALLKNGFIATGEVNFAGATIGGDLDCSEAQLEYLNADHVKIDGSAFFDNYFSANGLVNLYGGNIGKYLGWSNILSSGNTALDLRGAKIGILDDRESSWPSGGKLLLDGFTYDRIGDEAPVDAKSRIQWVRRQPNKFLPQPYEQLAFVLRKMGRDDVAREVLFEKNQDRTHFTKGFWEWLWYKLNWALIGYGYKVWLALIWSGVVIVTGACIFKRGYKRGRISATQIQHGLFQHYLRFSAILYSLEMFLPFLKLKQSELWKPCSMGLYVYLCAHVFAGWLLTLWLIAGATGLIKQ